MNSFACIVFVLVWFASSSNFSSVISDISSSSSSRYASSINSKDLKIFALLVDAFQNEWKDNLVWTNLEIAGSGNMHPMGTRLRWTKTDGRDGSQSGCSANRLNERAAATTTTCII